MRPLRGALPRRRAYVWPSVSTHAETLCARAATLCTQARVAEAEARASAVEAAWNESAAAISRVADFKREITGGRHEAAVAVAVEAVAAPDAAAASGTSMVPRAELEALKKECREAMLRWVSQLEQISELELSLQCERREKAEV